MPTTPDAAIDPVADLRRQMAQIRRELHEDMQGLVAGAEEAGDWKHYVKTYPWAALGVAAAVGYFIVPKRQRSADEVASEAIAKATGQLQSVARKARRPLIEIGGKAEPSKAEAQKEKSGVIGMLFGMVAPIALKAAQNYAMHFAQNWLAQQQQQQSEEGPPGGPSMAPGASGRGPVPGPDLPPPKSGGQRPSPR